VRASKKASHNVTSTIISLNATSATAVRPMNDNGCQHLVPMIHIDDRHQAAIGFFIEAVKRRPTRTLISLKLFFPPMAVTRHDKKKAESSWPTIGVGGDRLPGFIERS